MNTHLIHEVHPVVTVANGVPLTTSTDVARCFEKRHDNILRDIENIRAELPFERLLNFEEGGYTLPETGNQQHKLYHLTRDGFTLLAMGFTGKKALAFKLVYIDAFNKMEAALRKPVEQPAVAAVAVRAAVRLLSRLPDQLERERHPEKRALIQAQIKYACEALGIVPPDLDKIGHAVPPREVPPALKAFWEIVDRIGLDKLNHSRSAGRLALNLPHIEQEAKLPALKLPPDKLLYPALHLSESPHFIGYRNVSSALFNRNLRCWVFKL
jgi:Rha family phage regulatory protein